jgi:hypothetical protein
MLSTTAAQAGTAKDFCIVAHPKTGLQLRLESLADIHSNDLEKSHQISSYLQEPPVFAKNRSKYVKKLLKVCTFYTRIVLLLPLIS